MSNMSIIDLFQLGQDLLDFSDLMLAYPLTHPSTHPQVGVSQLIINLELN